MARVNVFLSDDLLAAIDAEAERSGERRSALVQEALRRFLDDRNREREAAGRRREMEESVAGMDRLAERLGGWDPAPLIRRFRERDLRAVAESKPAYRTEKRKRRR